MLYDLPTYNLYLYYAALRSRVIRRLVETTQWSDSFWPAEVSSVTEL